MNAQIVYLIRHGAPLYPVDGLGRRLVYGPGAGLTDEGLAHSARLARRLRQREGAPLEALVSSPYTRAAQTAAILARAMGLNTVTQDDRLQDTRSTWEGLLADDFMATFRAGKTFDDPHTLETLAELGERMLAAYNEIMVHFAGKRIGLISHGDPIRALYFRLYHPQEAYPPYLELTKKISLGAAEGIRLQINPRGRLEPNIEIISAG
jgi:broad specificity phosphatase PhoE